MDACIILMSLESLWNGVKMKIISAIYYLKHLCTLVAEDESEQGEYLDAITGSIQAVIL